MCSEPEMEGVFGMNISACVCMNMCVCICMHVCISVNELNNVHVLYINMIIRANTRYKNNMHVHVYQHDYSCKHKV